MIISPLTSRQTSAQMLSIGGDGDVGAEGSPYCVEMVKNKPILSATKM